MARLGRLVAAACLLGALAVVAGCDTAADASRAFGNPELVNDMASRLTTAGTMAYTAVFLLPDNSTVSIAHTAAPDQTAYRYQGGMVLLAGGMATVCATGGTTPTCTTHKAARSDESVLPDADVAIERGGLVRPETVIAMLTQAAQDPDVVVSEQDRTIAGTTATCVQIGGVSADNGFSACVTTDGLLASFVGTIGSNVLNLSLDHYMLGVASDAFALPAGANATS